MQFKFSKLRTRIAQRIYRFIYSKSNFIKSKRSFFFSHLLRDPRSFDNLAGCRRRSSTIAVQCIRSCIRPVYPGANRNNRLSPLSKLASLAHEDFNVCSIYRAGSQSGKSERALSCSFYNKASDDSMLLNS